MTHSLSNSFDSHSSPSKHKNNKKTFEPLVPTLFEKQTKTKSPTTMTNSTSNQRNSDNNNHRHNPQEDQQGNNAAQNQEFNSLMCSWIYNLDVVINLTRNQLETLGESVFYFCFVCFRLFLLFNTNLNITIHRSSKSK